MNGSRNKDDKHVCIVGGGSAIGSALVNWFLYGLDNKPTGNTVTAVCRTRKPSAGAQGFSRTECGRLRVVHAFSQVPDKIDALITLTGSVADARLDKMPEEAWQEVIDSTLTSVYRALNALLPKMRTNPGGNVVVVGSVVASTGGYGCANYAAAKAGLEGLVRAAANEQIRNGVRVNLLRLGFVQAGMGLRLGEGVRAAVIEQIPMKRFASLDEVVDAVDFLARTTYQTGDVVNLAGGLR